MARKYLSRFAGTGPEPVAAKPMLKRDLDSWYLEDRLYQRKLQMLRTSA